MNKALDALQPYADVTDDLTIDVFERACLVLSALLTGAPVPEELWSEQAQAQRTHTWVPVLPRSIHMGDVVRVKDDAYPPGHSMYGHNGREGVVQAIRGGVMVGYSGRAGIGPRHEIERLERQVQIQPQVDLEEG